MLASMVTAMRNSSGGAGWAGFRGSSRSQAFHIMELLFQHA
jgi:hypothetical protein